MILFLKKKTGGDAAQKKDAAAKAPPRDFLPYHSHYDARTLITKNGELMQTIRITANARGLDYESGANEQATVRAAIREAILSGIHTDKMSLWIHTVRKRRPVRYHAEFRETFAAYADSQWRQKHHWKHQYYNEIYITVLHDGQHSRMFDGQTLKQGVTLGKNRQYRRQYLEAAHAELEQTVSAMLASISAHYKAQLLSIVERRPEGKEAAAEPAFFSEPMEFLGLPLNLRPGDFPVRRADIGHQLANHSVTFGFNALETRSAGGKRRFGAILTLKRYREVSIDTADRLLQAPMEFVVTQTFHFTPAARALKPYEAQKELFEISGDTDSIRASGIEDMLASDHGEPTDFGMHQTSIMVMTDDHRHLDDEVTKIQAAFAEIGLITVREDIKLEECFWSQMPGNSEFIRRRDTVNTARIAGFCRLNRFPMGAEAGNAWGDAVALMPTTVGSPYFFNFHRQDNGHTLLLDFNSFHDHKGNVLLNFLLTETRKFDGRLYVFDRNHSTRLLFDKLGGQYHHFASLSGSREPGGLKLNPFTLENNPRNQSFLLAWCAALAAPSADHTLSDAHKELLKNAIGQLYADAPEQRNLNGLASRIAVMDAPLAKAFAPWLSGGRFAGLLDAAIETPETGRALHAFDITPVARQPESIIPVFSYLLHRIITNLDGRPTILVLHEACDLLENAFFAPRLESLLDILKQHNAMAIFTTSTPMAHRQAYTFRTLMQQCATRLYLPDDVGVDYASPDLGLDAYDARLLQRMQRQHGEFLLKQDNESIALRVDLNDMDDIHAVFSNDVKNLIAAGGAAAGVHA